MAWLPPLVLLVLLLLLVSTQLIGSVQNKFIQLKEASHDGTREVYFVNSSSFKHRLQLPNRLQKDYYPFFTRWFEEEDIRTVDADTLESLQSGPDLLPLTENVTALQEMKQLRAYCPCSQRNERLEYTTTQKRKKAKKNSNKVKPANFLCFLNNDIGNKLYSYLHRKQSDQLSFALMPLELLEQYRRKEEEERLMDGQPLLTKYPDFVGNAYFQKCSVVFRVLPTQDDVEQFQKRNEELCPGSCRPIPEITLPLTLLTQLETFKAHHPVLCSMTVQQLRSALTEAKNEESSVAELSLLATLAQRRVEECFEADLWPSSSSTTQTLSGVGRRKVFGMVMWIGSNVKLTLLQRQYAILSQQPRSLSPKSVVVGWAATEDIYGCARKSRCVRTTSDLQYRKYMPRTFIPSNKDGWACAQRRPLRALSHALLLYDAKYMLVVDDDTFVSSHILFSDVFAKYVKQHLAKELLFVSRLYEADLDITPEGFYWGGSGYLLGKALLDRLNSFELPGPVTPTGVWTGGVRRTQELSVLFEAMAMSRAYCSSTPCLELPDGAQIGELGLVARSHIRVVDVCRNLLADEDTCYHSDHSLSRCMAHAVYANFTANVKCWKFDVLPAALPFAMCYYNLYFHPCDSRKQLTCHRHAPSLLNISEAEKL